MLLPFLATTLLAAWALLALRARADRRADEHAWQALGCRARRRVAVFEPASLDGLPEPARRYLAYTIAPGTPLATAAIVSMQGEIGLGTRDAPGYRTMRANQIIAAPAGFVWQVVAGSGPLAIHGSDGLLDDESWSRFRLFRVLPVARGGASVDHLRSAWGRLVAEAVFFTPAVFLDDDVSWSSPAANVARASMRRGELEQSVDIAIAADGEPRWVSIQRWTNANPEKVYRLQPFGGMLSGFREVDGYRLPAQIEGGNHFGTQDYFPFFRATVQSHRFLAAGHTLP